MVRVLHLCRLLGLTSGLLLSPIGPPARAADGAPPPAEPTLDPIRNDWLLQARLRFAAVPGTTSGVTAAEDAAGGCDGTLSGKWGFHTALENDPWWQVDLGSSQTIDRIVIHNRGDGFQQRTAHIEVLFSGDGQQFRTVYVHDGSSFFGGPDKQPLVVPLGGQETRFVRLRVPGHTYFHLDEVQVLAPGSDRNIALHQPAMQSSVSQWSARHSGNPDEIDWPRVVAVTLQRGLRLAAALDAQGVDTTQAKAELARVTALRDKDRAPVDSAAWQDIYFSARQTIRRLALANPVLDFDRILFVKRAPSMFPHLSDQYYGWWARPGGGIFVLDHFKRDAPAVTCLTDTWPAGNFLRPDLGWAAGKVLFAFSRHHAEVPDIRNKRDKANLPEDVFYHLFELDLKTGTSRQLTRGKYDDFDGRYLPDDRIVFLSTRKGQFLQTSRANTELTLAADLPDSYVRCGGDDYRPVPVFTLHSMDRNGSDLRPISAFETFEYTPSVSEDGRVLYCRWDYIDRFNGHFFSLWATNPDGTNAQLVYGNVTRSPQATFEPRSIPGSPKILFTGAAHHSVTGGSLALFDPAQGIEGEAPLTRLTPEVPFPEAEQNVGMFYANPWPLSEDFYLVSWSGHKLPPHGRFEGPENPVNAQGIYLCDRFGNLELLYRDPRISSMTPLPIKPRRRPPVVASGVAENGPQIGQMLVQDIYQGLSGIERGRVKWLRIIGALPKVQPHMNTPSLGVSREETGKFVLGRVPVAADGSTCFEIPSGLPVFFQALDQDGQALQTMRSLTYVQPGQTLSCVGCHEPRQTAPRVQPPLAMLHGPSKLEPGPVGTWPLRFDTLVQPVLDTHCRSCHQPGGEDVAAARFDLTPARAWRTLLDYADKDLEKLVFERDVSLPGEGPSLQCKLLPFLRSDPVHRKIALDAEALRRLITWMDTYGQVQGAFSTEQEQQLEQFREQMRTLFVP